MYQLKKNWEAIFEWTEKDCHVELIKRKQSNPQSKAMLTIEKKFRSETLTCGCCWDWFSTWEWYVDQDQDKGYWICKKCQKAEQKRTDKFYDDTFEMIYNKVNDDTRAKFDARIKQLGKKKFKIILVNMALDKGRIKRGIWGKK